ncbi:hypothetical protein AB6A40_004676 [Gnathostoma spinigerum]|uniref:CRAL-TRIO domain-containing protein n=1 Tax=Gnathostoma spinigerum TaxID=75299 RepID=A0ABD6EFC2_9BILA
MHVDLSSAQRECLEKVQDAVRGKIHPNYNTVFNILRFCQHANFDANIAAFQLEQHLRFREDFNLDEGECLLKEDVVARECTPTSIIGRNRIDGDHLVIIDRSGLVDIANLLKSIEITSYMHQRFRLMERLFKLMNEIEQEKGKQAYVYYIFDLTGLKYNSMIIPFMKGPFKNMWIEIARHYREWIKSFIVVNAPTYLNMLSSILLPLIPDDNFKKRLIFANGNGSEQLLKLIDAECLPELYGGKADNSVVDEPKEIPSSFFWKPKNDYPHPDDLESISIPAGKQRIFTFELHSESCILHAYLMHEDTIATGVNYTSSAKVSAKAEFYYLPIFELFDE